MTGSGGNILVAGLAAVASLVAAVFWFLASRVEVRHDIDVIVADMQRVSELNADAAGSAAVAALCSIFLFVHGVWKRGRSAPPSAGFFSPVASLRFSSDAQASHFEARLATGQNHPGQMIPINPEPL